MSVAGGAVFPPIQGYIAHQTGSVAIGYVIPLLGYVIISLYGLAMRQEGNSHSGSALICCMEHS
jgi:FHS family L-fucose permease-like MFS transporter